MDHCALTKSTNKGRIDFLEIDQIGGSRFFPRNLEGSKGVIGGSDLKWVGFHLLANE